MSAAKIRAPHAFNASRSFVISVFIHEHSLSTRVLGVKSGEQGDKSVSLMRVVPKPSHAVCFWSWANSQNTRVCVSEQSGVQTSARRVSENTRVCGVLTKAKKGAGSRHPLAVSRRCFTHRAPSVTHPGISIGHTQLTYRATHYEGITTARRWRRIICATEGMAHGNFSTSDPTTSDGCRRWNLVWANTLIGGHGGAYAPR